MGAKRLNIGNVYADTRGMSREEWLESRRNGIGGSDASAILGVNPYSSPLKVYLDKIGKGQEEEENEAMRQGTDLEQYVADRFVDFMAKQGTPKKVRKVNKILQHPDYPWMLANIDREVLEDHRAVSAANLSLQAQEQGDKTQTFAQRCPKGSIPATKRSDRRGAFVGLECKTTSPYSKFRFDEGEINPHYYWQCVHYMAVTGADRWYVSIVVLGKSHHVFCIERDEDAIQTLIEAEREFWEDHVEKKEPPLPTGSEADGEALNALYPAAEETEATMALDGLEDMLNLRAMKVTQRDALQEEIDGMDQQIKAAMGTFEKGVSESWTVRWTNTSSRRIDTKALKAKYPAIAEECMKVTSGRRFTVTKVDAGDE